MTDLLLKANSAFSPILKTALNNKFNLENHNKNKFVDIIINLVITDLKAIEKSKNLFEKAKYQDQIEEIFDLIDRRLKISKTNLYDALNSYCNIYCITF